MLTAELRQEIRQARSARALATAATEPYLVCDSCGGEMPEGRQKRFCTEKCNRTYHGLYKPGQVLA